jgi:hypothetical protein
MGNKQSKSEYLDSLALSPKIMDVPKPVKNQRLMVSEASERFNKSPKQDISNLIDKTHTPKKSLSPLNGMKADASIKGQVASKDKLNYSDFVEKVKNTFHKKDSEVYHSGNGSSSRNNLDSLHQKPDMYDAFFMEADKKDGILDALRDAAGDGDDEYLIQEIVANRCMFKSIYHYKYHEDVVESNDLLSALILPIDDRLHDQRINMLEFKQLLQNIAKDKAVIKPKHDKDSLKQILMPILGKHASVGALQENTLHGDPFLINIQKSADLSYRDTGMPDRSMNQDKMHSRKFLDSKFGKIQIKNIGGIEAGEEQQAMKNSIICSLREFNGKGLMIHDKSYDMPAEVSNIKSQRMHDSSASMKGEANLKSFLFDFQKTLKHNVDHLRNNMVQLKHQGLKENFIMKCSSNAGRLNFYIKKKQFQYGEEGPGVLGNVTGNKKCIFLAVPDTISVECKYIEELKFKFNQAYYFEVKDSEEAFFYFRVESNISGRQ